MGESRGVSRGPLALLGLAILLLIPCIGPLACGDDDNGTDADAGADVPAEAEAEADADADADAGWPDRFDPFVGALLDDLMAADAYGVSAAVMEDGVVTFAAAFGSKDPDGLEPLTPETLMQIGSSTKSMTAVALLRQVEAGAVTLDDTLEAVLPGFEFELDASWDEQVTLHSMLSMQSGLNDVAPMDGSSADDQLQLWTYDGYDAVSYLMNPPGSFWNYSNPNFALAGLLVELLDDDRMWPDLMRQDVWLPLGMDRTFARKADVEADGNYADSYGIGLEDLETGTPGPVTIANVMDPAWARPAGMVWTTPTQMMAWADFLMHGDATVLADAQRARITERHVDTLYQSGTMWYGYGMIVHSGHLTVDGTWYETTVWEHPGRTASFTHMFYMLPEQDFAVAICSSGLDTDFMRSVDAALETLADLPAPSAGPEYVIDPTTFDRHVGTYTDPWNVGDMIITRDGDTLQIAMPMLESAGYSVDPVLIAISSEIFYVSIDGSYYELTFIPATPGGDSQYVRNGGFVAVRVPDGG